jgi:hypothetical protein
LGNGVQGAGVVSDIQTVTFGGAPSAGSVTLLVAGKLWTFSTAAGVPADLAGEHGAQCRLRPDLRRPLRRHGGDPGDHGDGQPGRPLRLHAARHDRRGLATPRCRRSPWPTARPARPRRRSPRVAGVETMPFPKPTKDIETYTTFDPGNNGYKRKIAKLKDSGDPDAWC